MGRQLRTRRPPAASAQPAGAAFWVSLAAIVYVHVGYLALLTLLARRRDEPGLSEPQPRADEPSPHSVSMIISALNEESVITQKLKNSLSMTRVPDEIIVVTDGSTDATAARAEAVGKDLANGTSIRVLHQPQRLGKCAAINRGAEAARGTILALSDANNLWSPDALEALLLPFDSPTVGGVTGQRVADDSELGRASGAGYYASYEERIRILESDLGACTAANGEIMALRREAFQPIPSEISTDDLFLAMSVLGSGFEFVYAPGAVSTEPPLMSDSAEFERRSRFSAGRLWLAHRPGFITQAGPRVAWQFTSHKLGRLLLPFFFVGAFVGAAVAWPSRHHRSGLHRLGGLWATLALGGQVLGYGGGIAARWAPAILPRPLRGIGRATWFLMLGNAAAINGWWRFLRGRREVVWKPIQRPVG